MTAPVGRLAPSPTGAQHVGNARTYLTAWLSARSRGGRVVLRIEDLDSPRIKPHAAEQACHDLRWLGLDWDEGPVVQTTRTPLYQAALARLRAQELVYPCTCTRGDIERSASAPHADQEGPIYPGTCAYRTASIPTNWDTNSTTTWCWRCRVGSTTETYDDLFRGQTQLDLRQLGGDFVVWKAPRPPNEGATPAYQLAVVVDDADQGVTEVVRGDDLVPSTPRQLLLYRALGLTPPRFAHIPLVVGPDGRRLAKRHGDTRLSALRAAGVTAEALLGLLAWSCGWMEEIKPVTARELLPRFRLETIPPRAFMLTEGMLRGIGYG